MESASPRMSSSTRTCFIHPLRTRRCVSVSPSARICSSHIFFARYGLHMYYVRAVDNSRLFLFCRTRIGSRIVSPAYLAYHLTYLQQDIYLHCMMCGARGDVWVRVSAVCLRVMTRFAGRLGTRYSHPSRIQAGGRGVGSMRHGACSGVFTLVLAALTILS